MKKLQKKPVPTDLVAFQSDENYRPGGFPPGWFQFYKKSAAEVVEVLLEQMPHSEDGEALLRLIWKANGA